MVYLLQVVIQPYIKKFLQSGEENAHLWTLTWKAGPTWKNPLMGWTASCDPMSQVVVSAISHLLGVITIRKLYS
jgi:hypothetical protein